MRSLARGAETVLGDAAADDELFLTSQLLTRWAALPACQMDSACRPAAAGRLCMPLPCCSEDLGCCAPHSMLVSVCATRRGRLLTHVW